MGKQVIRFLRGLFSVRVWGYGLFWSWNAIFLAFMFLGFAPYMLPQMIVAVRTGTIPPMFLAYAVILTLIPAAAVILGATVLRRSPGLLLTLGYGVEGPLMLALGIRFFVIRDATLVVNFLMLVAALGFAAFLWQILDRRIDERGPGLAHVRLIGLTLVLALGVYVALWIGFYAIPGGVEGLKALGNILWHLPTFFRDLWRSFVGLRTQAWAMILFSVLGAIVAIYTATLLAGLPIAMPIVCIRAWWRGVRALAQRFSWMRAAAISAVMLAATVAVFALTNRQPQHQAFALLKTPPVTLPEAKALLDKQAAIRAGLLNSYLAQFRYVSAVGQVGHVSAMYESSLRLSAEQAKQVERLYEVVARPLLYEPVNTYQVTAQTRWANTALTQEPAEAATLYKAFFDQPINDGERATVLNAVRSTWSFDQAQAAWQAVDDREVHLARQEVNVVEHGDWAEVELYEVYQNQTTQRQEVVYYFSLPESAVVTGVWLGDSARREARFEYRVAPRGAAQAVYRNEVRRQMDPALVEQIGPRQYRLRVFPIEPQRQKWEANALAPTVEPGAPMHMWLTFRVMARTEGGGAGWPLPRLADRRNVYWDAATVRLLNGKPMPVSGQDWLPDSAPAMSLVKPAAHRVDLGGEAVLARPVASGDLPAPLSGLRLAIVVDRSRSMALRAAEVKAALAQLGPVVNPQATDVYLTASKYYGEEPSRVAWIKFNPDGLAYAGGQNAAELLAQFNALNASTRYDAILVLTDGSGYELATENAQVPPPAAPVWMIHLGGDFPLGYDDGTLAAIQASGGGVVARADEALQRLAFARSLGTQGALSDIVDGYVWATLPVKDADALGAAVDDPAFAPFGARRAILAAMQRERGNLGQLSTLDQLHALAVRYSVVTPYSSMLVLVTSQQKNLLDTLEQRGDRFEREVEQVGETVAENPFSVTGVPEPEEWLLMALAAAMLAWFAVRRTRAGAPATMRRA